MFGKPIFLRVLVGFTAAVMAIGIGVGYFGLGKRGGSERAVVKEDVSASAPAPAKATAITISGQFKKDLSKHPEFVLGDRPIPFEGDEEDQKSFLAGGSVEIVSLEGDVVASGKISENGTFAVEIPPAPKYIVRAKNGVVSVSYAVITGGLPDMKKIAGAKPDAANTNGEDSNGHGGSAEH